MTKIEQGDSTRAQRKLAGVSLLALLAASPAVAQAQAAPATDDSGNTIVVTGIRHSVQESITVKRNSLSIVEAITSEDIGKMPTPSIAEALTFIPGIAAQRVGGKAEIISIRGFPPDFTATFLNGRPQASSGYNRAVQYDQYPAETISRVELYKTPNLDLVGMGLSGTTDLQTVRPLAYGKHVVAVNVLGEINSAGHVNSDVSNKGFKANVTYISQFADNTIGVAISFAHSDEPAVTQHTKNWFYGSPIGTPVTPASAASDNYMGGAEIYAFSRRQVRNGVTGTVEFKPSDGVRDIVDIYYSRYNQRETMRGAEWFSAPWAPGAGGTSGTFSNIGTTTYQNTAFATTGTYGNFVPILIDQYNTHSDTLFSAANRLELNPTDRLKLAADLSYSRAHARESYAELYAGYGTGGSAGGSIVYTNDAMKFAWSPAGDSFPQYTPGLNYADASKVSLGDRAAWGGWGHDALIHAPDIREDIFAADLGGQYSLNGGLFSSFHFGVNYQHTKKSKYVDESNLFLNNSRAETLVKAADLVNPTNLGFAGFGNVLSFNLPSILANYYTVQAITDTNHYAKAWTVTEDVFTGRAKLIIDHKRLHGDIGAQLVFSKQNSAGTATVTGPDGSVSNPIPLAAGTSYVDFLPNLNLIYDIGNNGLKVRFAAGRTMARPRMDDMRASYQVSLGNPPCTLPGTSSPNPAYACYSGSVGNPKLRPWRATAVDLSLEKYFGGASYLAVTGFYKKLDSYIYNQILPYDFSQVPRQGASALPPGVTVFTGGTITMPANALGGNVWGVEVGGALDLKKISPLLEGFGLIANYSYNKSEIKISDVSAGNIPMPGNSKNVYSVTAYYERHGFQARANYRYRSAFLGEVVQLFANTGYSSVMADKQLDAQIGYTFPKGSHLAGVSFTLQGLNLLNNPYRSTINYNGVSMPEIYEKYGATYLAGFGFKF
ncbi:MAG: TonB-dependent receptor [Proteobacteria bacterium]|nr:TonB-dependent receptor [Pseudomonadota bacterium]